MSKTHISTGFAGKKGARGDAAQEAALKSPLVEERTSHPSPSKPARLGIDSSPASALWEHGELQPLVGAEKSLGFPESGRIWSSLS